MTTHALWMWSIRFVLSAIAAGLGLTALRLFRQWLAEERTQEWPAAIGTVKSVKFSPDLITSFGEPITYTFDVIYEFNIGDKQYEGNRYSLYPKSIARYGKERSVIEHKYQAGANVQVFYNPSLPSDSILIKGTHGKLGACITALLLCAAVIFAIWLLR